MSLFAKHITAVRNAKLSSEIVSESAVDPLSEAGLESKTDEDKVDENGENTDQNPSMDDDMYAEQRALLEAELKAANEVDATVNEMAANIDEGAVAQETDIVQEAPVEEPVVEQPVVDETVVVEPEPEHADDGDGDNDEDDVDGDDDFVGDEDEMEAMVNEIYMLSQRMDQQADCVTAIESFGINPGMIAIMQSTNLLSGTALESLGLEAFGFVSPKAAESQMALEALGDSIKEGAAKISAKMLSIAKYIGGKVVDGVKAVWHLVSGAVTKLASFTWDKTKLVGKTIKAHPYKTILAIVIAIAAVAGILVFTGSAAPAITASREAMTKFSEALSSKISSIKWPFGSVVSKVAENGTVQATVESTSSVAEVVTESSGWTSTTVKALSSQMTRAYDNVIKGLSAVSSSVTKAAGSAYNYVNKLNREIADELASDIHVLAKPVLGNKAAYELSNGYYMIFRGSWYLALAKIIKAVVVGGFKIIYKTISALTRVVGGSSKKTEEAAA